MELVFEMEVGFGVEQREDLEELRRERRRWGEVVRREGGSLNVCIFLDMDLDL